MQSRWLVSNSKSIIEYYQTESTSIRYALYSQSLDRFLIVDNLDIWAVQHAAKLLSSKMSTIVTVFSSEPPTFGILNCLNWTILDKSAVLPKHQSPSIHLLRHSSEVSEVGLPQDFSEDIISVLKDQEFALFVLKATYAIRLTSLKIDLMSEIHNQSHEFYLNMCGQDEKVQLQPRTDRTIWKMGFATKFGSILYHALTIDEALNQFECEVLKVHQWPDIQERTISEYCLELFFIFLGKNNAS